MMMMMMMITQHTPNGNVQLKRHTSRAAQNQRGGGMHFVCRDNNIIERIYLGLSVPTI